MRWSEDEDEECEFEWKDEDEEEISVGESSSLSRINVVAKVVFLGLLVLGFLYVLIRMGSALSEYFG